MCVCVRNSSVCVYGTIFFLFLSDTYDVALQKEKYDYFSREKEVWGKQEDSSSSSKI